MWRLSFALLVLVAAAVSSVAEDADHHAGHSQATHKYTCLMHPEIVRDAPGDCPKCGMPLVPMRRTVGRADHADGKDLAASEDHRHTSTMPAHAGMKSSIDIADPMSRESSGTSWVPDSTPMYGRMFMFGDDMLMLHGGASPRYTNVDSPRGDDRIDAPNWFMGMYSHPFSDTTQLGFRGMMSLDPLTEGGRGYPLLYQTGESWHDQALHDRQHPHDLFDELSATVSQAFVNDFSTFLYFGYPGEPALGPPTFMHRLSAMDNPDAPISHHWQDSTHITFGVTTLGLVWKNLKLEGSVFTGREPDEDRYDFDRPRFDSASARLSWNPTPDLALQISHGYIKSPEALEPDVKVHRTTASVIYNRRLGAESNWSNSFVWGQNDTTSEGKSQSFLVETDFQWKRETVYGRFEFVQKSGDELVLVTPDPHRMYDIKAFSAGYVHDFCHGKGIDVGLGGQFTVDVHPASLNRYYGDNPDFGFQIFFRIRPSEMAMTGMSSMNHEQ